MAQINPKKIGDITYTQEPFWRVISLPIKQNVVITKGALVTIDAAGRLVLISGTTVTNGMFQPLVTVTAGAVEDTDFVQVACMGSRMLLKASTTTLTVGNPVAITSAHDAVVAAARTSLARIGTIFEIYTRSTNSAKKQVTAIGDLVVVETGMY